MADNGGLYLSPDFSDFGDKGAAEIAALIDHYAEKSPGAKIFVACGSMGGMLCWKLAATRRSGRRSSRGLLLLGSLWDESFLGQRRLQAKGAGLLRPGQPRHGVPGREAGGVLPLDRCAKSPGYPARFVRFETGTHGTPIRMTDWRETLNWMLSVAPLMLTARCLEVEHRLRVDLAVVGRVDIVLDQREVAVAEHPCAGRRRVADAAPFGMRGDRLGRLVVVGIHQLVSSVR